eukprot:gnl/MRDRNA2_/MRDRNA2_106928_c0_seq1.p1 gnl/MRDRNA2_/MRDRNA2_106928_c0~~gnl/MRDRNA2_/MRDRNA2_106928_c0_seq1.p1  ORF type:complete len:235 (+),score=45.19 gnl/MRDRNA2_/MRDRNA2_106928_c0_seq1:41-745(+)
MSSMVLKFVLCFVLGAAQADWVNELKLTLANFALEKATSEPVGFLCATIGNKHDGCHCWNSKGEPSGQTEKDCHMPPQCLMYSYKNTGAFNFTNISASANLHQQLAAWGVPSEMYKAYDAAALVESADFQTFNFEVNDHKAHFDAHIGTLRKWQGSVYLGYVFGTCDGDMVQPMVRSHAVPAGDCHGTTRGMKKRGYTTEEVTEINEGLQAYAFRAVAKRVQPNMSTLEQFVLV